MFPGTFGPHTLPLVGRLKVLIHHNHPSGLQPACFPPTVVATTIFTIFRTSARGTEQPPYLYCTPVAAARFQ